MRIALFRAVSELGVVIMLLSMGSGGCVSANPVGDAAARGAVGGNQAALIGVWRADFVDPTYGAGTVELILQADGSFLQQTSYQFGALVTIYGTYRFPADNLLRLDIDRGEPAQSCGPLGCTDIIYPVGETHGYTVVDANTLTLTNVNCVEGAGTVCTITYTRTV